MNPSTALATVVVDELIRGPVHDVVLSPGSRNAPLSFALHAADAAGRLRLHVRVDERTAGFLALGLAKASDRPVAVVTTSGTGAVNLHPAVVEADHSGVRLLVLTADRPKELHEVGANQTIDQQRLYGGSVRFVADLSVDAQPTRAAQEQLLRQALASGHGPVHINVAFRDPLVPDGPTFVPPVPERVHGSRGPHDPDAPQPVHLAKGPRTVVVAGDGAGWQARWLAEVASWPLLAEPPSNARCGPNALSAYRLYVDALAADVERAVVFGRPTLSRDVGRLLARDDLELVVVPGRGRLLRPGGREPVVGPMVFPDWVPGKAAGRAEPDPWLMRWLTADLKAQAAVATVLAGEPINGPAVARAVAGALPPAGLLVAGSSGSVRDLDLADPWDEPLLGITDAGAPWDGRHRLVLANRGASGIDGTVSTAVGAALAHKGPAHALMGDLTFLHDSTGLVIGPDEPRPDLTIVVVNDDGGGLFHQLEQGAPEHAAVFERVFGTPHGVDLAALCAATGTLHAQIDTLVDLAAALSSPTSGIRVVEVPVDRSRTRDLHVRLRSAVADAMT